MKKYYLGLIVLAVLVGGVFIYAISQGISSKKDVETLSSARSIAEKLNNYVTKEQKIPSSLSAIGINNSSSTIQYTKLDDSKYRFCAKYKNSSAPSVDTSSLVSGALLGNFSTSTDTAYSGSDYNPGSLYISDQYTKGNNCQTVEPYLYNVNFSSPSISVTSPQNPNSFNFNNLSTSQITPKCSPAEANYYTVKSEVTVDKVNQTNQLINFLRADQVYTDSNGKRLAVGPINYQNYDSLSVFYDSSCHQIEASSIKSGQRITIYSTSSPSASSPIEQAELQ